MKEPARKTDWRWRIAGEIVFVPFLACICTIVFHALLYAREEESAVRKSVRMTAHEAFGGQCPFRACTALLSKPSDGATMAVDLDSGDGSPATRLFFRFAGKTSQWIPVPSLKPESEQQSE